MISDHSTLIIGAIAIQQKKLLYVKQSNGEVSHLTVPVMQYCDSFDSTRSCNAVSNRDTCKQGFSATDICCTTISNVTVTALLCRQYCVGLFIKYMA